MKSVDLPYLEFKTVKRKQYIYFRLERGGKSRMCASR